MRTSSTTIGSIDLQNFEVPTSIRFGGQQRLAVHRLADGTRAIEALGPDDHEIKFKGIFSGQDAAQRARAVDRLRYSGEIVGLRWQSFYYRVIIRDFVADYSSPWWISYRISCVVADQSRSGLTSNSGNLGYISLDLSQAMACLQGSPITLDTLSAAIHAPNALIYGTATNTHALLQARGSLSEIDDQISESGLLLQGSSGGYQDPNAIAPSFVAQVNCAGSLAALVNARSYVSRASNHLIAAGS